VLAEKPTADGKHQVKVTEEGIRCCSPSCPHLIEEIDAHVGENPALKEKLDPLRKRLEIAQGDLESARLRQDRALNPEEAAAAAGGVDEAAKVAADVAAEVKPEIDKIVRETPLPSGLHFNEFRTPEAAIGMKEGRAGLVGNDPVKEAAMIEEGYTERHYYRDNNGKKWSVFVREVDGKLVYREGKPSSGQDLD
jgi:Putative RNase-like toxin, toxin_1